MAPLLWLRALAVAPPGAARQLAIGQDKGDSQNVLRVLDPKNGFSAVSLVERLVVFGGVHHPPSECLRSLESGARPEEARWA